jgi:hypothetical protein
LPQGVHSGHQLLSISCHLFDIRPGRGNRDFRSIDAFWGGFLKPYPLCIEWELAAILLEREALRMHIGTLVVLLMQPVCFMALLVSTALEVSALAVIAAPAEGRGSGACGAATAGAGAT